MFRRSLKLHLFIQLLLISFGIILSNRILAQHFLTEQLRDKIHQDMARALTTCGDDLNHSSTFLNCFKAQDKGSLLSNVSDFYVLCHTANQLAADVNTPVCRSQLEQATSTILSDVSHQAVELLRGHLGEDVVFAVRYADALNGQEIRLKQTDADRMVLQMWQLRDQNLIRVLPIVLVLLFLSAWYMTRSVLRPVVSIEKKMSTLDATNLGGSSGLKAPFKEFETLVSVFESLRVRLDDSFTKARRFASDASHELRTPLTILRGGTERLINDLPTGSELQVRVRDMGDEVERLIDITEKLLLLSRADANSLARAFTPVDISQMLLQMLMLDEDEMEVRSRLTITSDIQPGIFWLCDKTLIVQLIHNLYENAQKYNQPHGWIRISLVCEGGQFQLTIENPSMNTPADLTTRAFDRFYRGDASHTRQIDGLGLGLSICMEIAKIHNGSLSLSVTDRQTVLLSLTAATRALSS
jgi:signal transduction histidine kinase